MILRTGATLARSDAPHHRSLVATGARKALTGADDDEAARVDAPNFLARFQHVPLHPQKRAPAAIFMDVKTRTVRILDEDPA
jgi:hypothetical protein